MSLASDDDVERSDDDRHPLVGEAAAIVAKEMREARFAPGSIGYLRYRSIFWSMQAAWVWQHAGFGPAEAAEWIDLGLDPLGALSAVERGDTPESIRSSRER